MARLDAVGIVVSDLAVAVKFYRLLGVPFAEGAEMAEHGHADGDLGNGMRLMLDTEAGVKSFDAGWQRGTHQLGASLAFRCEDPSAVDALYEKAIARGGRPYKEPWDAFWGQRYAQLRDPDGNYVELYAELK